MIKRFFAWFTGSYEKQSLAILKGFAEAQKSLQEVNNKIVTKQSENLTKLSKLQEENEALAKTLTKNAVVCRNISNLLGEDIAA